MVAPWPGACPKMMVAFPLKTTLLKNVTLTLAFGPELELPLS